MISIELNWDDAKAFLAVARTGTLTEASAILKSGVATTSRKIERLEKSLGMPLFVHHQTGYLLTDEGKELLPKAELLESAAINFEQCLSSESSLFGSVKLATSENIANLIILPNLEPFVSKNPNIRLDLNTGFSTLNIHGHEADLAVRMVKPERGNVSIRKLGTLGFGLYGSKSYVKSRKTGRIETNFEYDKFITWSDMQRDFPAAQYIDRLLNGRNPTLTTTSLSSQLSATKAGLGLSILPHFLASHDNLVQIPMELELNQEIWLAIHSDLRTSLRVRAVADHLISTIHLHKDLLAFGDSGVL